MPNPVLTAAIDRLSNREDLDAADASKVLAEIIEGNASEAQAAAFRESHPNITIEPQLVPWDDYWTKLQTSVAGGAARDQ